MSKKSIEERLEQIERKEEELRARKQKLRQQASAKERKERTRRLIQKGAIYEAAFGCTSVEEAEDVAKALSAIGRSHIQKIRDTKKEP